jgi:dTDP-4-amino-4,6-dideoxygalactose transaminase
VPKTNSIVAKLADRGVTARPFWKPVHLQAPYASFLRSPMPVCESVWDRVLMLPCSTNLTSKEQETAINALIEVLKEDL